MVEYVKLLTVEYRDPATFIEPLVRFDRIFDQKTEKRKNEIMHEISDENQKRINIRFGQAPPQLRFGRRQNIFIATFLRFGG